MSDESYRRLSRAAKDLDAREQASLDAARNRSPVERDMELRRLGSALGAVLREVRDFAPMTTDPVEHRPIQVGAVLYIKKLFLRVPPVISRSLVMPLSTVVPLRERPDPNEQQRLVDAFDRRVREGQIILPPRRDP